MIAAGELIVKEIIISIGRLECLKVSLEASITKLTFYRIRCFLLSKDAFTPNYAKFGSLTIACATNLALNQSRIEIFRVRKKLQNRQKLMTFSIVLNL